MLGQHITPWREKFDSRESSRQPSFRKNSPRPWALTEAIQPHAEQFPSIYVRSTIDWNQVHRLVSQPIVVSNPEKKHRSMRHLSS